MSLIQKFSSGDVVENRYHLDIRIHEGRWGDIYRATDQLNDRPVAIRFFPISDDGPADFERFTAHARELSGLTAPSIAVPIDHGMDREIPYLVFRWAHGQDLQDRLAERGPLSFEQTLTVVEKILHGLHQAHQSHLTHGLIRPVKIAVDDIDGDDPFVKLVDFQIWRFFEWSSGNDAFAEENLSRRIVRYTAPEVLDEHRVKPVTDLYATGLVTIEMLTGQPAFDDNHRVALIARQMSDELAELAPDHRAGTAFRDFLKKLVAKDPQKRFPTASKALSAFRDQKDTFLSEPSVADQSAEEEKAEEVPDEPPPPEQSPPSDDEEATDAAAEDERPAPPPEQSEEQNDKQPANAQPADAQTPASKSKDVDPDTELFEGEAAKMRSLSDGRSLDEGSDELFDDDTDFGDFYSEDEPVAKDDENQAPKTASSPPESTDDDDEIDPAIADEIPVGEKLKIHAPANGTETTSSPSASPPPQSAPTGDDSDISMGTYVAIIAAMVAATAAGVYFIAFHDANGDEVTEPPPEPTAAVEEEEPDPITIDTMPPRTTVIVDSPSEQLIEGRSTLKFKEYSDDDFPLTITARRGESETSIVLEEYTDEVLIELDD